eukprot:TRINITY_DN4745_c0_g1_i1.p1 TRINITY_DN4745_c0_g1~~TRINITY_DN4745_c0_g1_i1.p1  ORF type:complete len:2368 (+),score=763.88 TRINITY_DN4745_c0_g1_i1:89-7192(+)
MAEGEGSAVRVVVRVRPLNAQECAANKGDAAKAMCVKKSPNVQEVAVRGQEAQCGATGAGSEIRFKFDQVYWSNDAGAEGDQDILHRKVGTELLHNAFAGYNCCLFAYGQTGSGKTHTMMGEWAHPHLKGLIPRACEDIFARMQAIRASRSDISFTLNVSYMEIYLEQVYDLLSSRKHSHNVGLKVRQHPTEGVFVEGLTKVPVLTLDAVMDIIAQGNDVRHTGSTKMNARSSRSHALLMLHLTQLELSPNGDSSNTREAKVNLVDLAGSERTKKSEVEGDAFNEATKINLSLTTLGRVIDALADMSDPSKSKKLIQPPYRESILTHILSDSLGGNSKTTMLATISPHITNVEETTSTLRYASRAREIVNKAVVNEDPGLRKIKALQEEVDRLTREIRTIRNKEQLSEIIDLRLEVDLLKKRLAEQMEKNLQLREKVHHLEKQARANSGTYSTGGNSGTLRVPKGDHSASASPNPVKESFERSNTLPLGERDAVSNASFERTLSFGRQGTPSTPALELEDVGGKKGVSVKKGDGKDDRKSIAAKQTAQSRVLEKEADKRVKQVEKEKDALARRLKVAEMETARMKKTMTQLSKEKAAAERKAEKLQAKTPKDTPLGTSLCSAADQSSDENASMASSICSHSRVNLISGGGGKGSSRVSSAKPSSREAVLQRDLESMSMEKRELSKMLRDECMAKELIQEELDSMGQQLDISRTTHQQAVAEQRSLAMSLDDSKALLQEQQREAEAAHRRFEEQSGKLQAAMTDLGRAKVLLTEWQLASDVASPDGVRSALTTLRQDREKVQQKVEALRQDHNDAQRAAEAAKTQVQALAEEVAKESAAKDVLSVQLKKAEAARKSLEDNAASLEADVASASEARQALACELKAVQQIADRATAVADDAQKSNRILTDDLARAKAEHNQAVQRASESAAAWEVEKKRLEAEIAERCSEVARCVDLNEAALTKERRQWEAEVDSVAEELRTLRREAALEKEEADADLASLRAAHAAATASLGRTQSELAAAQDSVKALTAAQAAAREHHTAEGAKHAKLMEDHTLLGSRMTALQKAHDGTKAEAEAAAARHREAVGKHEAERKDLSGRLSALQQTHKDSTADADALAARHTALAGERDALQARKADLEEQLRALAARASDADAETKDAAGKCAQLQALYAAEQKALAAYKDTAASQQDALQAQLREAQQKHQTAAAAWGADKTKMEDAHAKALSDQQASHAASVAAGEAREAAQQTRHAEAEASLRDALEWKRQAEEEVAMLTERLAAEEEKHSAAAAARDADKRAAEGAKGEVVRALEELKASHAVTVAEADARDKRAEEEVAALTDSLLEERAKHDAAVAELAHASRMWDLEKNELGEETSKAAAALAALQIEKAAVESREAVLERKVGESVAAHAALQEKHDTAVAAWVTEKKEMAAFKAEVEEALTDLQVTHTESVAEAEAREAAQRVKQTEVEADLRDAIDGKARVEETVAALNDRLTAVERKHGAEAAAWTAEKKAIEDAKAEVVKALDELDAMHTASVTASGEKTASMTAQLAAEEAQHKAAAMAWDTERKMMEDAKVEAAKALAALQTDHAAAEAEKAAMMGSKAALEEELSETVAARAELQAAHTALREEYTAAVAAWVAEKEHLEEGKADVAKSLADLRVSQAASVIEVEAREAAQGAKLAEVEAELRAAVDGKGRAEEEAVALSDRLVAEEEMHSEALAALDAEKKTMEKALAELDATHTASVVASGQEVATLTAQLAAEGAQHKAAVERWAEDLATVHEEKLEVEAKAAERDEAATRLALDLADTAEEVREAAEARRAARRVHAQEVLCVVLEDKTVGAMLGRCYRRLREHAYHRRIHRAVAAQERQREQERRVREKRVCAMTASRTRAGEAALLQAAWGAWMLWCMGRGRTRVAEERDEYRGIMVQLHTQNNELRGRLTAFDREREFLAEKVIKYRALYKSSKDARLDKRDKRRMIEMNAVPPRRGSTLSQMGDAHATHGTPYSSQLPSPCSAATNDYLNSPSFARAIEDMAARAYDPAHAGACSLSSLSPLASPKTHGGLRQRVPHLKVVIPSLPQEKLAMNSVEPLNTSCPDASPVTETRPPRAPIRNISVTSGLVATPLGNASPPSHAAFVAFEGTGRASVVRRPAADRPLRRGRRVASTRVIRARQAMIRKLMTAAAKRGAAAHAALVERVEHAERGRRQARRELEDLRWAAREVAARAEAPEDLEQRAALLQLRAQEVFYNTLDRAEVLFLTACRAVEAAFHQHEVNVLAGDLRACSFYIRHPPRLRSEVAEERLMALHDDPAHVDASWRAHDQKVRAACAVRLNAALRRKHFIQYKPRGGGAYRDPVAGAHESQRACASQ